MWIFIGYIILWALCGFWALIHVNDTDENDYFKIPWRLYIFALMFLLIPFVARLCRLI